MRRKSRTSHPTPEPRKPASTSLVAFVLAAVLASAVFIAVLPRSGTTPPADPPSRPSHEFLEDAEACIERGDLDEAESLVAAVLGRDVDNGMAWLYRGQLVRERGELDQALEAWRHVPDDPAKLGGTARYLEATVLLEKKMARHAEQQLLKATVLNPTYLPPYERLLELYVLQMREAEIRKQLDRVQSLRELTLDELILRISAGERIIDAEQAIAILETFIATDPEDISSRISLARYLNVAGRHEDAAALLTGMLARWPNDQQLRGTLIESVLASDRIEEAASLLSGHAPNALSPSSFWRSAGELASAKKDLRRAAACFEQVVKRNSDDQQSHYHLGLLLRQLGHEQVAQSHLEKAAILDRLRRQTRLASPKNRQRIDLLVPVIVDVGDILARLERPAEAMQWYQHALSLNPREAAAIAGLERTYEALQHVVSNDDARQESAIAQTEGHHQLSPGPTLEATAGASNDLESAPSSDTSHGPIELRDVHQRVGLTFQYFNGHTEFKYLIEAMGGGVAVLDYDADGWPDLYFPQGCALPVDFGNHAHSDRLFRNVNGQAFVDVTERAGLRNYGYAQGCAAGDLDNDGFVDLIVANFGRNVAYHNNGDGTFKDVTETVGFTHERMSSSLALVDLDRDGDLDLYVVNYVDSLKVCRNARGEFSTCRPESFGGEQDELYLNRGDGSFEDGTAAAGIVAADGKGLGIVTADFDGDGWPDVYVANDTTPNFLFHNQGQEADAPGQMRFVEMGLLSGAAMSGEGRAEAGMGVACADLNGDLSLDLFVTNYFMESNTAYFNQGNSFFADVSREQGLTEPSLPLVGFGAQAVDLDLDGWSDLLVANGHIDNFGDPNQAWKMPTQVFHNLRGNRFEEVSKNAGTYFQEEYLGRGVARLDWNRDGRPDLVVVHQDAPAALLENETNNSGHFSVLELHGVQSNRDAIGAKIHLTAAGRTQFVEICGGDGFYASNERRQVIGLGAATQVESLKVTWPSGQVDQWRDLPADCALVIVEGQSPEVRPVNSH